MYKRAGVSGMNLLEIGQNCAAIIHKTDLTIQLSQKETFRRLVRDVDRFLQLG